MIMSFQIALQRLDELFKRHFPVGLPTTRTEALWATQLEGPDGAERWFDNTFASFLELRWTRTVSNRPPWMGELSGSLQTLQLAAFPSQYANVGTFCSAIWVEEVEFGKRPEAFAYDPTGVVLFGCSVRIERKPYDEKWLAPLRLMESESAKRTVVVHFGDDWLSVGSSEKRHKLPPKILAAIKVVYKAWPESLLAKEIRAEVRKQTGLTLPQRMDQVWGSGRSKLAAELRGLIESGTGGGGGHRWVDTTPA